MFQYTNDGSSVTIGEIQSRECIVDDLCLYYDTLVINDDFTILPI